MVFLSGVKIKKKCKKTGFIVLLISKEKQTSIDKFCLIIRCSGFLPVAVTSSMTKSNLWEERGLFQLTGCS